MKVFADLVVRGGEQALSAFLDRMKGTCRDGWSQKFESTTGVFGELYCFTCTRTCVRPHADVWLSQRHPNELRVTNVLSPEFKSLTYDQYNQILRDFLESCVKPAARDEVQILLSETAFGLTQFLSERCATLLQRFSREANRSMLTRDDLRRWNEFVTLAHREDAPLDEPFLRKWLEEDEGWPELDAERLADQYARARDLLRVFVESQPA
ncbi:MAG: hypothetical protein SFV54_03255 [Bryobacteraceae bacterium]|nr:hypothetical protein [Bryobacteraceae bacterium]